MTIDGRNLATAIRLWNGLDANADDRARARALERIRDELEFVRREVDNCERLYTLDDPPPAPI